MKNISVLLLIFFCSLLSMAQGRSVRESSLTRIMPTIDPIEGIWNIAMHEKISNPFIGGEQNNYSFTWFIFRENDKKTNFIVSDDDGVVGEIVKKNGSYRFIDYNARNVKTNILINNMFNIQFAENDKEGYSSVSRTFIGTKKFPTQNMYAANNESGTLKKWTGTGFSILEGYVVTNYHVVENAKTIYIQGVFGDFIKKNKSILIATDKVNDIAILKLEGSYPKELPYSVKTFSSEVGEDVWVLGFPLTSTMGDEVKLTTGIISAKSGYEGDVALYQISAPVQPGNSGGPVFDKKGNLIGIVCAHHKDAENVSYAIKAAYLRNLIESSFDHNILPQTNNLSTTNLTEMVKSVKDFVYYIQCSNE